MRIRLNLASFALPQQHLQYETQKFDFDNSTEELFRVPHLHSIKQANAGTGTSTNTLGLALASECKVSKPLAHREHKLAEQAIALRSTMNGGLRTRPRNNA